MNMSFYARDLRSLPSGPQVLFQCPVGVCPWRNEVQDVSGAMDIARNEVRYQAVACKHFYGSVHLYLFLGGSTRDLCLESVKVHQTHPSGIAKGMIWAQIGDTLLAQSRGDLIRGT